MIIEQMYKAEDFITENGYNLINHANYLTSMTSEEIDSLTPEEKVRYNMAVDFHKRVADEFYKQMFGNLKDE